ncbi:MAG: transposase family protein [Lentisphaerae bacterium]|nr:transposase family protein [Lentisphaerota bacterium]
MVNQSKREYLARIKDRYRHAGRKGKARILDEFCAVCGHHRKHAIRLLNADHRRVRRKPGRPRSCGADELQVLEDIWLNADCPCSVRLAGMIKLWLPWYEKRHGDLDADCRQKLEAIRPRTLDRLLLPVRRKHGHRGLTGTRHGDYLKHGIPIKISHRDVDQPGFIQADTVAHGGNNTEGDFVWSLTFTDVFTGWTENGAVWNKGEAGVHELLRRFEDRLPFRVRGFHTDNGGEFINHHLHSFYRDRDEPVQMTRGRPGRKNDNPHVEQKNYTHVRGLLGYRRIDNPDVVEDINLLYEAANLLRNFFCTTRRLIDKQRRGSRYYKRYDAPATPCERLLATSKLYPMQEAALITKSMALDPYNLRTLIDAQRAKIMARLR